MIRAGALVGVALALGACAVARVRLPDGTAVTGLAIGHAAIAQCAAGGVVTSPGGAFVGPCTRIAGGPVSGTFLALLSALASAAVALWTYGAAW